MLNFKVFHCALLKYNIWHYGIKSSELFCEQVGIYHKYIDYEELLGISYQEFGFTGLIVSNIALLSFLILILIGGDIGNYFLKNTISFVLCLKKFDLLNKFFISKFIAILFLLITFSLNFYWSISLLFVAIYENIIAFKKEVHYDYL